MKLLPILLSDELTGATAFDFADGLARHGYEDYDGIVFQLNEDSSLDVNGMAVIMRIYSHLQSLNKRLYVVGANAEITRGLSRLGLAKVLNAPKVAQRPINDTDPTLATLTGRHRVVS
ncbi:MAG: anti-anti-sigma regulatory factor [Bradymonadia bacterium]|jgi:anti-anti-sigma regulatory factor